MKRIQWMKNNNKKNRQMKRILLMMTMAKEILKNKKKVNKFKL